MTKEPLSNGEGRAPYEPPKIETYTGAEILKLLGPAVAVYGGLPGAP